mmetsp:Transcript_20295/g.57145  ORF Transcript_20295/g.57145 Transcript_20295/m.57145 type:complete len:208 (+) Transcript_20295:92-715(+)
MPVRTHRIDHHRHHHHHQHRHRHHRSPKGHVHSQICSPEARAEYTTRPSTWAAAMGRKSARLQLPVASSSRPVSQTPRMPGSAPAVLVMPSREAAYLGDRSWWLQYRPARLQVLMAKARESTATIALPGALTRPPLGVRAAQASMQRQGRAKAAPWASLRTRVVLMPRRLRLSATVPTMGTMATMARLGMSAVCPACVAPAPNSISK